MMSRSEKLVKEARESLCEMKGELADRVAINALIEEYKLQVACNLRLEATIHKYVKEKMEGH